MLDPVAEPTLGTPDAAAASAPDPGLTGSSARPVAGIDNGFLAGYRVRFDEAGPDGRVRTSALLRYAQDVAWRHSEDLGFDRIWYTQRGRWWVVRSVDLAVLAPIPMGQTLRVSTAVIGHRRIWARRLSECRLADGTLAATVTTDWVILDDRGRLVRIPDDFGLSFSNPVLPGDIVRVEQPEPPDRVTSVAIRVRPQDLDPMGHVNNATYVDWVEEGLAGLGLAGAVAALPRDCRLEYRASAAPGDELTITAWHDAERWQVRLVGRDGLEFARATGTPAVAAAGAASATELSGKPAIG
jgi:acyl-CoA thioesterase FadM